MTFSLFVYIATSFFCLLYNYDIFFAETFLPFLAFLSLFLINVFTRGSTNSLYYILHFDGYNPAKVFDFSYCFFLSFVTKAKRGCFYTNNWTLFYSKSLTKLCSRVNIRTEVKWNNMKGVIYARFSCDNQREESIEGQIRECKEFAKRNDIEIIDQYVDRAKSATTDKRPDFQRMIADSAKHDFEVIIVWKLDRFARNRYDSAHYKALLRKNGVRVVSATEAISEGAEGVLLESVLEGMAEYYSKELSEKTLRGMTENALKCKSNGGFIPIGLKSDENKNLVIDEQLAPLVLEAFRMYDDGATIKDIVRVFDARGIKTRMGRKININTITHMLHNRKYIGEYSFKDIVVPHGIPAIVDEDLFDRVQEKMLLNHKNGGRFYATEPYLLTAKLYCGKCNRMLAGESARGRNGKKYQYYKCPGNKYHQGCDLKAVKKEFIENIVVTSVHNMLFDDKQIENLIAEILKETTRTGSVIPVLESQLHDVEKGIENIINAIEQGVISSTATQRINELEKAKLKIEAAIEKEKRTHDTLTEDKLRVWFKLFRGLDLSKIENRKRLIDSFVNAIYLFEDKLIVTFNYQNGTQTIKFSEVENTGLVSQARASGEPVIAQTKLLLVGKGFGCVIFFDKTKTRQRR